MFHHVFLVYRLHPKIEHLERQLVAKYAIIDGNFAILADYAHVFADLPEGKLTPQVQRSLDRLKRSGYYEVVPRPTYTKPEELAAEEDPDPTVVKEDVPKDTAKPSVFEYLREGMSKPHRIEVRGGVVVLDGNTLSADEGQKILSDARSGLATIRYVKGMGQSPVQKSETFADLHKAEGSIADSWAALKGLVDAGHLSPDHFDAIRKELYVDELVPGIGNKRAFLEHLAQGPRQGVYAAVDANHLKSINDNLGHEAGDSAIKATGNAMRAAIDGTVGSENAKSWRTGGDEFYLHANSHDDMAQILRHLRGGLEAVPALGGTHKLSVTAGIGTDHKIADQALYHAKAAKMDKIRSLGGDPEDRMSKIRAPDAMYAHSLVPGHEGPVPTDPVHTPPAMPTPAPMQPHV